MLNKCLNNMERNLKLVVKNIMVKNFRKIFKRCPICGGKILYTECFLKKSVNEKNYKRIKIFYCKHCENKEEAVEKCIRKLIYI